MPSVLPKTVSPPDKTAGQQLGFRKVKRTQGFLDLHARVSGQAPWGAVLPKTVTFTIPPAAPCPLTIDVIIFIRPSKPGKPSLSN